jgi:hypothetical protein
LEEKVHLNNSSKESMKQHFLHSPNYVMAEPLFRNQGQKLAGGETGPASTVGSECRKTKKIHISIKLSQLPPTYPKKIGAI